MKADLLPSLSGQGATQRAGLNAAPRGRGPREAFATVLAHVEDGKFARGAHGRHDGHVHGHQAAAGASLDDAFPAALAVAGERQGAGNAGALPDGLPDGLPGALSTSAPMSAAFDAWAGQRGLHGLQNGLQHDVARGASLEAQGAWFADGVDAAVQRAAGTAAAQLKANGPALPLNEGRDVEDSLWSERSTTGGKASATKKRAGAVDDVAEEAAAVEAKRDEGQKAPGDEQKASASPSPAPSWTLSTATSSIDHVEAVRDVPAGPLMVATDHLRALLPEGGRVLAASAHHVSLELPHQSGPMLLEVSLKSGVVDVRARGGAAGEMAWRVPELAAALQSAGVRLGSFEVAPMKKSGDASAADDGPAGDRQNSDGRETRVRRSEPRGIVAELAGAFTSA